VAVAPDGRRAVSGSYDRMLRLWDLESGKEIAAFTGESDFSSCAFALGGRTTIAVEISSRVQRLVEADETKPSVGDTKIQLLSDSDEERLIRGSDPRAFLPWGFSILRTFA
jgi:WD40 repeat protein